MTFPLPDSEFGARVARRLRDEVVAWLTLVDRSGAPQPAPVWYGDLITSGWQTAENFASIYSVPVRIRPRRLRGH